MAKKYYSGYGYMTDFNSTAVSGVEYDHYSRLFVVHYFNNGYKTKRFHHAVDAWNFDKHKIVRNEAFDNSTENAAVWKYCCGC